jgi:hypothetical protein
MKRPRKSRRLVNRVICNPVIENPLNLEINVSSQVAGSCAVQIFNCPITNYPITNLFASSVVKSLLLLKVVKIEALGLSIFVVVDHQLCGTFRRGGILRQLALGPLLSFFLLFFLAGAFSLALVESRAGVSSHRFSLNTKIMSAVHPGIERTAVFSSSRQPAAFRVFLPQPPISPDPHESGPDSRFATSAMKPDASGVSRSRSSGREETG